MTLSDERVNEILCALLKPKLYLPGGFLYIEPESIPDAARAVAAEAVAVERKELAKAAETFWDEVGGASDRRGGAVDALRRFAVFIRARGEENDAER